MYVLKYFIQCTYFKRLKRPGPTGQIIIVNGHLVDPGRLICGPLVILISLTIHSFSFGPFSSNIRSVNDSLLRFCVILSRDLKLQERQLYNSTVSYSWLTAVRNSVNDYSPLDSQDQLNLNFG